MGEVSRIAVFTCMTKIRHTDFNTVEAKVSVPEVEKETPEKTMERLKAAAKKLEGNYTGGCVSKRFTGFAPTPGELVVALKKAETKAEKPKQENVALENLEDPCLGRWRNRPICRK